MWRTKTSIIAIAAGGLLLLSLAPRAAAQCWLGSSYDGIALREGNPFQAEKVTTFTRGPEGKVTPTEQPPALVARDSQGRVRMGLTAGKFKVEEGEGAGTEAVQRLVTICDPVSQKLVRLDTLNKTATVWGQAPGPLRSGTQPQVSFCTAYPPMRAIKNAQTEDLGHQTIEGIDARGVRTTRQMPAIHNGKATTTESTTEMWCSDELGVELLRVQQTGTTTTKMEMHLIKIALGEPDPALFQIPPDYRVVERVPEETKPGQLRPIGVGSATQPSAPTTASPQ
jgi:hypothetical protein